MTALIIIGAVLLAIAGILALKATLTIEYSDEVRLTVRVLCFRFTVLPAKKKRVNPKKYTPAKFRKMLEKKRKKELKRWRKKQKRSERRKAKNESLVSQAKKMKKRSFMQNIYLVTALLKIVISRFPHHLRIKLTRLRVVVGTDDAAKTAMLYGVIAQSVAYIIELLDNVTNVKYTSDSDISVEADFLSEKLAADIKLAFSLRIWHLLDILFRAAVCYVKEK